MKKLMHCIRKICQSLGVDVVRHHKNGAERSYPPDFTQEDIAIIERVLPFTYTSPERIQALGNAIDYLTANQIEGAIVECGVWKGGSIMAAMLKLKSLNDHSRECYLYDTYEGMTEPTEIDRNISGKSGKMSFDEVSDKGERMTYSSFEEVKGNVETVAYPLEKVVYVKGKVEDTIPRVVPEKIAMLRLDTDWYESTRHELEHLYPLLSPGGVIIIDDYGHWEGARRATDEYIKSNNLSLLLNRIDYTGRIGVKL